MSPHWKALALVGAAVLGLVAVLYAVSSAILMDGFSRLETLDTRDNTERAADAIAAQLRALDSEAGDWANWDETYNFIEDRNSPFIQANPNDTSFIQLQLDVMVFVHSSGRVMFAKAFDLDTEKEHPVPPSLLDVLTPTNPLLNHPDSKSSRTGILNLPEGPLLVASRPILNGQGEGPIHGTLIFGRFLDDAEVRSLADTTHLSLRVYRINDPNLPANDRAAIVALPAGRVLVRPIDADWIVGYKIVKDIQDAPALVLGVTSPRDIYEQGETSTRYLLVSLIVIGLALGSTAGALAVRLAIHIDRRKQAEQELRLARDHLEIRVADRTRELVEANKKLQIEIGERERAEQDLHAATHELKHWIADLERRNREINLLNWLGEALQTCLTVDEAYGVVAQFAPRFFPEQAGALCIIGPSRTMAEVVAVWGHPPPLEKVFAPEQCWALRQGHAHAVNDVHSGALCQHVHPPLPVSTLCVPMMAQGQAVGILHFRRSRVEGDSEQPEKEIDWVSQERLATAIAEHVALALMNLELRETLRNQAIRDPLTGLFNRRYMEETLERDLRRCARRGMPLGLVMLDLDHFKEFNDSFGHAAGDQALREIGMCLRARARVEDIACRYGGEEFLVIFPDASLEEVTVRAEQLRTDITRLNVLYRDQQRTMVTVSLGVATYPQHGSTIEALIHAADVALYEAKRSGRDRVAIATMPPEGKSKPSRETG